MLTTCPSNPAYWSDRAPLDGDAEPTAKAGAPTTSPTALGEPTGPLVRQTSTRPPGNATPWTSTSHGSTGLRPGPAIGNATTESGKIASDSGELQVASWPFAWFHPGALPKWWFLIGPKSGSPGTGRKGFENFLSRAITRRG